MSNTMKAVVIHEAGGPEVLKVESRPVPEARDGQVLIRVRAFGLNRSELFTRQGHSPKSAVRFPRVLGIEAVGTVELAPGGEFEKGETLLVRGGTTSVGLAAAAIAKKHGATVAATTRKPEREGLLRENGADQVFVDTGQIAEQVREVFPCGVNKVLELVGTTTLIDSLRSTKSKGIVCMTGMVGDQWSFKDFSPMGSIPTAVCLTTYSGGADDFMRTPLQELVDQIEAGSLVPKIGRVFSLDQIVDAHRCMEENKAGGKIVVLT